MLDIKALLLKLVNHYNNTGEYKYTSGTLSSLSSSTTLSTVGTMSNLSAGVWLCLGHIEFPANATGYRAVQIGYTPSGGSVINKGASQVIIPSPGSNYAVMINSFCAVKCDSTFNLHVRGCQNKGSAMSNVPWYIVALKLK